MALKIFLSTEDHAKLPDVLKAEYTKQADGRFQLQAESQEGWALEHVVGLKQTVTSTRKEADDLKRLVEGFKDLDPVKAREALAKVDEMKTWKPEDKVREQLAAFKSEYEGKLAEVVAKSTKREQHLLGQISKTARQEALSALAAHGVVGDAAELALPWVMKNLKTVEDASGEFKTIVLDEQGNERVSGQTGKLAPMNPAEFVGSLKTDKKFKMIFPAETKPGGGSQGGGGAGGARSADDFMKTPAAVMVDRGRAAS